MTDHPRDHECRELQCCDCLVPYAVWYADNELWNAVMRGPDGKDSSPFLCAGCFLLRAGLPVARVSRPNKISGAPFAGDPAVVAKSVPAREVSVLPMWVVALIVIGSFAAGWWVIDALWSRRHHWRP